MRILDYIKENTVFLDGAMGSLLQSKGLSVGEMPERWNISHPEEVIKIHEDYFNAGANIVCTNTFGANTFKFTSSELEEVISAAIKNAKEAAVRSKSQQQKWVALDVGPTGKMLKPLGDLNFEDAVSVFAESIKIGAKCGADLIFIETMNDCYETKAALLAAKENCDLPVFVSNAYGGDGKLMTGADPKAMIALLEGMGADAIGVNCSLGPKELYAVALEYLKYSSLPVIFKPNAGLPRMDGCNTLYDLSPKEFSWHCAEIVKLGARGVGGCCGTTPEHISALVKAAGKISPMPLSEKDITLASSYTHGIEIGVKPLLIGERINPTGKPKFREAVKNKNTEYILREAIGQDESGVDALDVNLGIPGINEAQMLSDAVKAIQSVCDLPLQIDSSDPVAMESALRIYNGKAIINSVNGKKESLDKILPLAKKYGGVLIALTIDENGIPESAEQRLAIAQKILDEAKKYGIEKKNIIFDPLAMAVSADKNAAKETLRAVKMITRELSSHTVLGISNVSFGLPHREVINGAFLGAALNQGLSAAIVNPYCEEIRKAYNSYLALSGLDFSFENYISHYGELAEKKSVFDRDSVDLKTAITKGLREKAALLTKELLKDRDPLTIINEEIIPALDEVGKDYEKNIIYLPGLLMSAEAAGASFDIIRSAMPQTQEKNKEVIIVATVRGDVHDIGKNIVKMILENYGYDVVDLGKDVAEEIIVKEALRLNAKIVGLSALMTTTVPAMERTVNMLKKECPDCAVMVGGAVLTEEYSRQIGADFYGKDAMDAVRFVQKAFKK